MGKPDNLSFLCPNCNGEGITVCPTCGCPEYECPECLGSGFDPEKINIDAFRRAVYAELETAREHLLGKNTCPVVGIWHQEKTWDRIGSKIIVNGEAVAYIRASDFAYEEEE
jgi:hypothetical protein